MNPWPQAEGCGLSVRTEAWCLGGWDQETKERRRSKQESLSQENDRDPCRREPAADLLCRQVSGKSTRRHQEREVLMLNDTIKPGCTF